MTDKPTLSQEARKLTESLRVQVELMPTQDPDVGVLKERAMLIHDAALRLADENEKMAGEIAEIDRDETRRENVRPYISTEMSDNKSVNKLSERERRLVEVVKKLYEGLDSAYGVLPGRITDRLRERIDDALDESAQILAEIDRDGGLHPCDGCCSHPSYKAASKKNKRTDGVKD